MKTVINASPAMKALIAAKLQKRSIWPWASKKSAKVDTYRLFADDQTQRVSGRIIVNGREKSLGRSLKQKLSEAYFYDRRPQIWAQSPGALNMTFARPALKAPARRAPSVQPQSPRGLLRALPSATTHAIAHPIQAAATPPAGAFENPRKLPVVDDRLGVPLSHDLLQWGWATQHLVDIAFARHSEDSTRSSTPPSLNVVIPHIDDFWGQELTARFTPDVRLVDKRHVSTVTHPLARHKSYVARLFDSADEAIALAALLSAQPLVPTKSILRHPTSETRRLGKQLGDWQAYTAVAAR